MTKEKGFRIRIIGDNKFAIEALDEVERKSSGLGSKIGTALKAGVAVAGAAIGAFAAEMKKSLDAAAEQEKAERMLAEAMKQHGTYSQEALDDLRSYASELQKVTAFGDEETLGAMQRLQVYGMETSQMKESIKVAQDLAAARGIDLATAADLVGKAYAGNTSMLSRYGIVLDQSRLQAEGFSYVLSEMNAMFGGQAAALADSYEGRLTRMKNAFSDLQETIGMAVLPAMSQMMGTLTEVFSGLQESGALQAIINPLADAFGQLAPLLGEALTSVVGVIAGSDLLPTLANTISAIFAAILPVIQQLGPPITQIATILTDLFSSVLTALTPVIQALAPIIASIVTHVAGFLEKVAPILGEIIAKLSEIVLRILEKLEPHIDKILDVVLKIADAILPVLPRILDLAMPILDLALKLVDPLLAIVDALLKVAEAVMGTFGKALEWIVGVLEGFQEHWSVVWNGVKSVFEGVWNGIVAFKDTAIAPIVDFFEHMWDKLGELWSKALDTLKSIVKPLILGFLEVAWAAAKAYDYTLNFGEDTAPYVERAQAAVEAWHTGGPIGGRIPGLGEVLLPLGAFRGGEWIIQEAAANALGPQIMSMINEGRLPVVGGGGPEIHIHVANLYGDREYVRMLARHIVREMPAAQFTAWGRHV